MGGVDLGAAALFKDLIEQVFAGTIIDLGRFKELVQVYPFVHLVGHLAIPGAHGDDGYIL